MVGWFKVVGVYGLLFGLSLIDWRGAGVHFVYIAYF